jgi:hypothetical protein
LPDEPALRAMARDAILNGRLPSTVPILMLGGPGCGAVCSLCGDPLPNEQMEIEIEFVRQGATAAVFHLHPLCFAAWHDVRTQVEGPDEPPPLSI